MLETPTFLLFSLKNYVFVALNSATPLTSKDNKELLRSTEGQDGK